MLGQTISHYRIISQLGVGGMGVVYAADDPRLNRQVALKFVPEELAHNPQALERLRSEARTASGLNHPNICTIYDIGEHEGRPFIVMELLKGVTLRDRLAARPLKIHEAVDIGLQVADALYWAHNKDVIHRDIKPANLFLVDQGQVKILDFGLAKLVTPQHELETIAPTVDLTAVGVAVGTVAYMSPEQVSGEPLDRRTDLFSLGIVLYECATGQQPFKGKTSAVVLASILTKSPTAPRAINLDVPVRFEEVINTCLEKDRELRYQDAAGLRADLKRIKRDLESGALKTPTTFSSEATLPGVSGSVKVTTGTADMGAVTPREVLPPPRNMRGRMIGVGAAVVAIVGLVLAVMAVGRRSPPASEPASLAVRTAPGAAAGSTVDATLARATTSLQARNYRAALAASEEVLQAEPGHAEATRIRDQARATIARFDEAVAEANRLLAAGDANGVSRALNTARDIDPAAPVVSELSARLVEQFKSQVESARRLSASTDAPRPQSPQPPRRATANEPAPSSRGAQPSVAPTIPAPASTPSVQPPAETVPASPEPAAAAPPVVAPVVSRPAPVEPAPAASQPAPARPDPNVERRTPPATTPAPEDDDAAIRRIVATYARAIETKDLALYRSVKPNLSALEQRRIEEGFRAVTSQRVTINVLSIDRRGQQASVRLGRHDIILAGGRQQTADSQQTMTLTKTGTGWAISEIGR